MDGCKDPALPPGSHRASQTQSMVCDGSRCNRATANLSEPTLIIGRDSPEQVAAIGPGVRCRQGCHQTPESFPSVDPLAGGWRAGQLCQYKENAQFCPGRGENAKCSGRRDGHRVRQELVPEGIYATTAVEAKNPVEFLNAVSIVAVCYEGFDIVLKWRMSIHLPARIAATAARAAAPALSQAVL